MSNENKTDRIIRNKLKYHASASPEHLWDAIDTQLNEDDKKGGGFWWRTGGLLGGLMLVGLIAVVLFNVVEEEKEEMVGARNSTTINAPLVQASKEKTDHLTIVLNKEKEILASESLDITQKTKTNFTPVIPKSNATLIPNQKAGSLSKTNNFSFVESKKEEQIAALNSSNVSLVDKGDILLNEVTLLQPKEKLSKETLVGNLDFTNLELPSKEMVIEAKEQELNWPSLIPAPKCATFGKWLKLHFYGDAYFSPDIAFRKLKSKSAEYESYAADREATETQVLSYSTGARFSVVSNYGIALRTGIVFSQINEVFKYRNENETRTIIKDVFDGDGNLIGTDTIVEIGARYKTTHNHYRMVDVPLLLGYEVNFKKITLALNSGIYANISSRQKGDFLHPIDLEPVTFTSDAENTYDLAFRKRLNLSLYGSIACMYNLNERWQLMIEPQVRYYLDPMTQTNYMVEQKYTTTGLITGLRYRF